MVKMEAKLEKKMPITAMKELFGSDQLDWIKAYYAIYLLIILELDPFFKQFHHYLPKSKHFYLSWMQTTILV